MACSYLLFLGLSARRVHWLLIFSGQIVMHSVRGIVLVYSSFEVELTKAQPHPRRRVLRLRPTVFIKSFPSGPCRVYRRFLDLSGYSATPKLGRCCSRKAFTQLDRLLRSLKMRDRIAVYDLERDGVSEGPDCYEVGEVLNREARPRN